MRTACSVRAIEDKVFQGLLLCFMGYGGGGCMGSFCSAYHIVVYVCMQCPLPVTHQKALCVHMHSLAYISSANGLVS